MRTRAVLLAFVVASVLVGCSSQTGASQVAVVTTQVDMPPSYRFDPSVIRVRLGQTVTWTNRDNFTHDVHLLGGLNWQSQPLHPGQSASYTFNQPGAFPYVCDYHSENMKGEVIVVPASQ